MASLHSGSLNESVELLRIETDAFDLYLKGKPFHPTVEKLQLHRRESEWEPATLNVKSDPAILQVQSKLVFSPKHGTLVPLDGETPLPIFYETQAYELVLVRKQEKEITFHHPSVHLRQAVKPLGKDILSGILQFQNEVGYTEFVIQVDGQPALEVEIEIFPTKMDYKTDYQHLLREVNEQVYNLAFDFLRKTYNFSDLRNTQQQSLTEFFSMIQVVFGQLLQAMERIKYAPHYRLVAEREISNAAKVKKANKGNIPYLAKRSHLLVDDTETGFIPIHGRQYRPVSLIESKRRIDYDTAENRFLRWVLERITQKLQEIRTRYIKLERRPDELFLAQIDRMINQLRRLLQLDFLAAAGKMHQMSVTLVLQMAPGYKDVYRIYLMLMKGLTIQGDLLRISLKDVAQLYEYWCFLKIHHVLSKKYQLIKQDLIRVNRNGLFVTLDRDQSARITYENPKNGEQFTLYYNTLPAEDKRGIPTLSQRPDTVLTLNKREAGQEIQAKYVFDAKYRVNPAYEGTSYYEKYLIPGPEEEDINTMHRYRDAIVYQEGPQQEYERSMYGAYVLFPYADEETYKAHRFYKSIELINVGAFPFLPGSTTLVEQFLDELILDSPEKAYERSTRPRGTQRYYQEKLTGKNVLIGSLRGGQLDVALQHRFYHVPLKNVKDHKVLTNLEYVAVYQSKKKYGEEGGIHWYGKIADWQVLPRKAITERPPRPGTEEELYVKFVVEEWMKREMPIVSGGQGIYTLMFTTKYIFDRAHEIAELRLENEEQLKEWREKRRRGNVKVELDHHYVDLAKRVVRIEGNE